MAKEDFDGARPQGHVLTTTMWKFAVGLIGLIFAGLLFVNEQFLTIREHTEYKSRVDSAIGELQTALRNHTATDNASFVSRNEFDRWLKQHDAQLMTTGSAISRLESSRPTTGELQASTTALTDRINRLENEVQELRRWQKKVNESK